MVDQAFARRDLARVAQAAQRRICLGSLDATLIDAQARRAKRIRSKLPTLLRKTVRRSVTAEKQPH